MSGRRTFLPGVSWRRAAGMMVALVLCGCQDVDWDWESQEWRRPERAIRPTRRRAPSDFRPHRPRVGTPRPQPGPRSQLKPADATSDKRAWRKPAPDQRPTTQIVVPAPADNRSYYKLYLISMQTSLKGPPNSKKIRLEKGNSRSAADVLNLVYPSIGPSGGEGQRFLVYQYEPMWSAATEFVSLLDAPDITEVPSAAPTEPIAAFRTAVGVFSHFKQPGQPTNFEAFKRCIDFMISISDSKAASGQLRWGAALLAGRIASGNMSDFAQARKCYEKSKQLALPGAVEEMISDYHLADTYAHQGQRSHAVSLARELVRKFTAHRASCVYERALDLASP